ncbi:Heterogeneous nuclear ribonucleoprotein R (RRM superfamily) [Handroanthus impetiginosus]|uniref:Heterogeneous nuclear ribonucleoprotein R (RRM superfamily) n=1 Tax=Handroanthus impetiginosus TaxID=429701 RepID=A0A2G9GYT2_9LAMI|nr:Heterogeneous nuclear ribonucleoprotein R (RRM superfamily) [Handroanthus impetiginosus]
MRTRSASASKSPATVKKTPAAARKAAAKAQATPSSADEKVESSPTETTTPKIVEPKRASGGKGKQVRVASDSEPQELVEQCGQGSAAAKPASRTKIVRRVVKKVIRKTPVSTIESGVVEKAKTEATTREETAKDLKNTEADNDEPAADENRLVQNVEPSVLENENVGNSGNSSKKEEEEAGEPEKHLMENIEELSVTMEPATIYTKSVESEEPYITNEKEELKEEREEQIEITDKRDPKGKTIGTEEDTSNEVKQLNASLEQPDDEKIEGLSDQEVHEEFGGEDFVDYDSQENEAEAETFEEEHMQLNAAARDRKVTREREVFVGGLDRDASEGDIRKVFEYAGEVVAVRMHVDPSTKKNMGYAFVQFATKEQASRALSEMKNPVIHGKRCGTAPSQDNDTLFLGNICNTWTKEAIRQKLKDYSVDGVENITLVADPRCEGLSRGFAFVEFSSHAEAMLAYKRLQKPDAVFGHSERTAKVAFAEPLREPDPEVMAKVKSVFIDGLPPHWDEDGVREKFEVFGEIARIVLARNMSTAKRKDFGFVHFKTHEAAVSCVEGVNNNGLNDGNSKDQDPEFAEPSRHHPRLDQLDTAAPFHGARYRDDLGADSGFYRQNYYGSEYGARSYSSFYGDDHTYGRGYYH